MKKLNSIDLAHYLSAKITVKFERHTNEYYGQLVACDTSSITLQNVQGYHSGAGYYRVFNDESFIPILRIRDDMTLIEIETLEEFELMSGATREAMKVKFLMDSGIDCFGWISKGLASRH